MVMLHVDLGLDGVQGTEFLPLTQTKVHKKLSIFTHVVSILTRSQVEQTTSLTSKTLTIWVANPQMLVLSRTSSGASRIQKRESSMEVGFESRL
jgi:hypothetical protein